MLETDKQSGLEKLVIRYWEEGSSYKFSKTKDLGLTTSQLQFIGEQVGDFDYNGLLDIMLIYKGP